MVQGASRGTEKEGRKTNGSRRSRRIESRKILNKKKIRGVEKYLVRWKGFTVEHDTWERREDLGNAKEVLEEFKGRVDVEVRRQEKIDRAEK